MQIFRPGANTIAILVLAAIGALPILGIGLAYQLTRSPYTTGQNVTRNQPVPFSHEHHVGGLGLIAAIATPRWRRRGSQACRPPRPA